MVYPTGVVAYLKKHGCSGNLLTPFSSGAYVSWMCYPDILVSIDGRYEVAYQEDVLPNHNLFYAAEPGWQSVLNEYNADMILVQANCPVIKLLGQAGTHTEEWKAVYEDPVFTLFVNTPSICKAPRSATEWNLTMPLARRSGAYDSAP